eukprot:2132013-Rhodomonas_salina.2
MRSFTLSTMCVRIERGVPEGAAIPQNGEHVGIGINIQVAHIKCDCPHSWYKVRRDPASRQEIVFDFTVTCVSYLCMMRASATPGESRAKRLVQIVLKPQCVASDVPVNSITV